MSTINFVSAKAQPDDAENKWDTIYEIVTGTYTIFYIWYILLRTLTTDLRFNVSYHDSAVSTPLRVSSGGFYVDIVNTPSLDTTRHVWNEIQTYPQSRPEEGSNPLHPTTDRHK